MKKIIIIILGIVGIQMFGSCSKDYLDTKPTSSTSTSTIFESTENAKLVINGMAKLMTRQWASSQGYNGEGTVKLYSGEYPGDAYYTARTGWTNSMTLNNYNNNTALSVYYAWAYYYMIIGNANSVIINIDSASGSEAEKQYIKAQALSYRAYCYLMLSQLYCKRWVDSNNGAANGLVLRKDPSESDHMPLSTLGEVYSLIYEDLNTAISLFLQSNYSRGDDFYEIDGSVARAILARAAITRQDYSLAATMASQARQGYSLMSVSEYTTSGFSAVNSEWIWGSWGSSDETLHYYSYFAYIAYNSTASTVRSYPGCISRELYDQIPDTDIRKGMFAAPLNGTEYNTSTGATAAATEAHKPFIARTREAFPALQSNATVYAYMQFKFKAQDQLGVGDLNHFRASEMILIEAEAQYFLGNTTAAQSLMEELVRDSKRDESYSCTKTGEDLLNEIKFYRKVELWGEGFNWFDLKRWKDPMVRHAYADGGSYSSTLAVTVQPESNYNWTFYIPYREIAYNDEIPENVNQ